MLEDKDKIYIYTCPIILKHLELSDFLCPLRYFWISIILFFFM